MAAILSPLLNVVAPVFLCVLAGYALAKLRAPYDRKMIGYIVGNVGYPALVLAHLSAGHVEIGEFATMAAAAVALIAALAVIAAVAIKLLGLPISAFLAPMTLGNVGNIGLPVASLAFGDAGLSYSLAFLVVVLIGMFTYGTWLPQGKVSLTQIATSPVIYAIIIALILMGTETKLPVPLQHTFGILGGLAIPLMLLTLGHTLATLNTGAFGRGALLAFVHFAACLLLGIALASLFGFDGTARGVFIVTAIMPTSVATYLFVEMYAPRWAPHVASLILVSMVLSVIALPFILTYVG